MKAAVALIAPLLLVSIDTSTAFFLRRDRYHDPNLVNGLQLMVPRQRYEPLLASSSSSEQWNETTVEPVPVKATYRPKPLPFLAGVKFLIESARGTQHYYLTRLMQEHGESFIIWNKYVTINDAAAIRDVLEVYNLPKPADFNRGYKEFFPPTGGILAAPWKEWIEQRRMANAALAEAVIGEIAPKFKMASDPMFVKLEQVASTGEIIEMDQIFSSLTLDTICLVLLGRTFGMLDRIVKKDTSEVPFVAALDVMSGYAMRQMVSPGWVLRLWGPSRKVVCAKETLNQFLEECISERLLAGESTRNETDLLNILLQAESKGVINRDDVKAQLLTFIFAGSDTTGHTLSYLLYEVSINKDLQDKVALEAKAALPDRGDFPIDPQILARRLNLLDRVWLETLRKHPAAATGAARVVGDKPIVVGDGLELPPGVTISMPPYSLHRNPRYWPDPEVFDPSRFEPEKAAKRDPITLLSFSAGPRNCIGSRLARAEALSVMAALFRRFEVTCVETTVPVSKTTLTTRPRDGIRFTFTPRQD
jgi:cytochrome P450